MHKRKHRKHARGHSSTRPSTSHAHVTDNHDFPTPDPRLYIQAHEADIVRGPSAASARSLERPSATIAVGSGSESGLIRWPPSERPSDTDTGGGHKLSQHALWVDRYDVRLLLHPVPSFHESIQARPPSPSGWSDLPSDSEDTFFFSPGEIEDYRREKRRRLIERGREERLRMLATVDGQQDPDSWGGSDEEPDETQKELIRTTASHIISSPNPVQMELRTLANYGSDKRFAFLRGRWSRVWKTEKERAKQHQAEEAKRAQLPATPSALEGLASYGDSDTNSDVSADKETGGVTGAPYPGGHNISDDAVKEARRARAKEWAARRRAEQSSQLEQG